MNISNWFFLCCTILYANFVLQPNSFFTDEDVFEDDEYFEEADMFSRLEEMRENLEKQLGCETFLRAYKTVQVCKISRIFLS